ncbi:MAG: HAMP domain-containing protein [Myxococcales bacterium]|nr:HAMP domain-containing protein [Myxococcales bacterium]
MSEPGGDRDSTPVRWAQPPPPGDRTPGPRTVFRLRLGHKLALSLIFGALVPVAAVSTVAVRLVLAALQAGTQEQTDRALRVALNLVLDHVKEVFQATARLAEVAELPAAIDPREAAGAAGAQAERLDALLIRREDQLPQGLVEVADLQGKVVGRRAIGSLRTDGLRLTDGAEPIRRALAYERRVTLERVVDGGLGREGVVVRAAAPVLDEGFRLRGAVVVTVPLDAEFADRLKAQLAVDVVLYAGDRPVASSFVAADGHREPGLALPEAARADLSRGATTVAEAADYGRTFSVGFAPLVDFEQRPVGMIAVARDEWNLVAAKSQAWRSLFFGGASAILFALFLAAFLTRRLTGPLSHLHAGARAVARGDLDVQLRRETGDEIGDLAEAFAKMTRAVREHQSRLAARMREITTLHDIGRAVSSVLALDEVLTQIVEQVALVLPSRGCVLLLAGADGRLRVGAGAGAAEEVSLAHFGEILAPRGASRIDDLALDPDPAVVASAAAAGLFGPLLAVPLEQKDLVLGLLLCHREFTRFSDADLRLVATFADHAATAIQNARLYREVQKSSEDLERKVEERTVELVAANRQLERTLSELQQAQAQLVLSERLAGLGALVAGIAHEINSPAGAIQGAVDTLGDNVLHFVRRTRELQDLAMTPEDRARFFALLEELGPRLPCARVESPMAVRRQTRELSLRLAGLGVPGADAASRTLVEIGAAEAAGEIATLGRVYGIEPLVGYLEQFAWLHRNTFAIRTAIRRVTRIVGALKSYSHLDQARAAPSDVRDGIENTLVILHHELKYGISIVRKYAELPPVTIYVDELNQVWTNLIHNAVQALGGRGEIVIETRLDGAEIEVAVVDSGPGIAVENLPRIFEPFFTTKAMGEGTGLGLGIVRQIVEKHGGGIAVTSRPGCTRFTVRLPVAGPPIAASAS